MSDTGILTRMKTESLPQRATIEGKLFAALLLVAGCSLCVGLALLWWSLSGQLDATALGVLKARSPLPLLVVAVILAALALAGAKTLAGLLWRPMQSVLEASLALTRTLEAAEQSRRDWVADTSHELRTPLAVLRAEIEALQDGVHEVNENTLGVLHSEVLHLTKLVNDLNELAQADAGGLSYRFGPTDLGAVLTSVADGFRERLSQIGLSLEIEIKGTCLLEGDADRLRQLWINLFENSLRYTNSGGRIRVEMAKREGQIQARMIDSAPGVPEGMHERLFERFFRADPSRTRGRGGSGIGLALVEKIVETHGGSIGAAASEWGGLEIKMTFPMRRE
jgi:two-component system sensor histidine kinase BaeS